jgi:hypothetical protein
MISGRFGVGAFGEFVFGAGTTFGIDVTIDVITDITDEATVVYNFNLIIDSITTSTYTISQHNLLGTQIDVITETEQLLNKISSLLTQIDSITDVSFLPCAERELDLVINTVSGTTFTIHIRRGYPLEITMSSSKRGDVLSVTRRAVGLNINR